MKGLIFSTEMAGQVINDRKTQTRRIIRPQPMILSSGGCWYPEGQHPKARHYRDEEHLLHGLPLDFGPYEIGEELYLKESFAKVDLRIDHRRHDPDHVVYKADRDAMTAEQRRRALPPVKRWTGGIFMTAEQSRQILIVTQLRAERIQDISLDDVLAEGMRIPGYQDETGAIHRLLSLSIDLTPYLPAGIKRLRDMTPEQQLMAQFAAQWDEYSRKPRPVKVKGEIVEYVSFPWSGASRDPRPFINGTKHTAYPNPYVWAISFIKRCDP